ncbi:hypothetical protein GYMLUDRAFT_237868 [Collybiopsis luxurians FD-317 M1]|nr:hypothetical protein GYMLUDRAFT_237868 [Collybiopsis luxurians FD-317 M1]
MKSVTCSTGLRGYLDGTITAPAPAAPNAAPPVAPVVTPINSHTPSLEEWELCNGCLAGIVYQNIKDPCSIRVTQDMSASTMWTRLTDKYEMTSAAAQTLAKEQIQQFKYIAGTPFEDYFKQLELLQKSVGDMGCTVSDDNLQSHFLTSLAMDYLWILQSHGTCTYTDLKCVLVEYNMMVESANSTLNTTAIPNALAVSSKFNTGIVCDNCGGSEGKAPCWYTAPKGMEPNKSMSNLTLANIVSYDPNESSATTAAATIYDFTDYPTRDTSSSLYHTSHSDSYMNRLGGETSAFLSRVRSGMDRVEPSSVSADLNNNVSVPTFIDSAASHWCIQNHHRFVSYTASHSVG